MARDSPLDKLVLDKGTEDRAIADPPTDGLEGLDADLGSLDLDPPRRRVSKAGVTANRERHFNRGSGRFHDPMSGEFEVGSPPPDLDPSADRYRAKNGRFKKRSADLFDESEEAALDSLEPRG